MAKFIYPHHRQEWEESAIAHELIEANLRSLKVEPYGARDEAIELLADLDNIKRDNTGRISRSELKKYDRFNDGGWVARGFDVETGEYSSFVCVKPDNPRWDYQKNKPIKYEHPRGKATEIFAPAIPYANSLEIAIRSNNDKFQKAWLQRFRHELDKEIKAEEAQNQNGLAEERVSSTNNSRRLSEREETETGLQSRTSKTTVRDRGESGSADCQESKRSTSLRKLQRACERGELGEISQIFRAVRHCKGTGFEQFKFVDSRRVTRLIQRVDQGFWESVKEHPIPVGVTEGFKKSASLSTQGYACVAVPGIWNWIDKDAEKFINFKGEEKSRKELTRHLKPLCKVKREFFLAFDEDTKTSTRRNVTRAQEVLGKVLSKNGAKVTILSWDPEDGKGIDDAIVANGSDWFTRIFNSRLSLSAWIYWNQRLNHVDRKLHQPFLTKADITSTAKLVGIKSAKGTGKTEANADYIQEYINQGQPVILLSHRVQLVKALTERFGIDNAYNFRVSDTKGVLGLALCTDSMHSESQVNFSPDNWDDFILVIDEVEQVIPHTLISSKTTVASHRTEVLANLSTLCQNASQIILSDADLSDRAFNYIRSLTGNCSQHIIQNDYQPARGTKLYNYKTPETWLDALVEKLGDGEKILIPTDSQQAKSTWGAQTLESLIKEVYSNLRVLRIDSETIVNPEHEAYQAIENLDSLISQYDVVIYTPVLGTGVSIDLKGHFDSVFSINQGTQSENSTRQFIARLREGIPRHCYFKAIGCNFLGGGETSDYEVHRSQKAQVKQNLSNLGKLEKSPLDFDGNHCKAYAQYIANHNLSLSAYRENVLEGLRQEGYEITTIEDIDDETRKDFRDMMKETRNGNYNNLTSAIAQTETPSDTELTALESKQELTDSQRHQLRKGKMEKLYGVEADKDLIEQDDDGLYANLSLLFWLTIGRDYVAQADQQKAKNYIEKTGGKGYEPDFNRTQYQAKVQVLEALRIPELLAQEGEITNDSLKWWWEHIKDISDRLGAKKTVKRYLGITLSDQESPIRNLGKILNRIGMQLTFVKQLGHKRDRQRVYTIERITNKQDAIFSHWLSQVEERLAKDEEDEEVATAA